MFFLKDGSLYGLFSSRNKVDALLSVKNMSEIEKPISVDNEEVKEEKQPQPQPFTICISATSERELLTRASDKSSFNSAVN